MRFSRGDDIVHKPQPDILERITKGTRPRFQKNNTQSNSCWVGLLYLSSGQGIVLWLVRSKPFVSHRVGSMGKDGEGREHAMDTETQDVVKRTITAVSLWQL